VERSKEEFQFGLHELARQIIHEKCCRHTVLLCS
jgi:hypothetical protein